MPNRRNRLSRLISPVALLFTGSSQSEPRDVERQVGRSSSESSLSSGSDGAAADETFRPPSDGRLSDLAPSAHDRGAAHAFPELGAERGWGFFHGR